jgi:glyoxylase-like metal-dependent hydrolase (beta-lactamase superfamily II)
MKTNRQHPDSKHFRIEPLADGVYAAIHIDGGAAVGNAGIVDLGDRTLVFDTFFTPQAAVGLRTVAEALTGRPIDAVINSHYHNDHIWGNQVFCSHTDIVSSAETRQLIVATKGHDDFESFIAGAEENLASTEAAYRATQDAGERRQLAVFLDYYGGLVEAKPTLCVRPPNITFDQRLAFHGTERSAELLSFDRGHTPSDAVLYLPQERIAFMSDLLFVDHHPWLGAGDPDSLSATLQQIADLNPSVLVPGHGPVGEADSLQTMQQYVRTLDGLAQKMVGNGENEETIDDMAIPEPYADWLFAVFFSLNMHFLYQRWMKRQAEGSA